ncbi:FMN-binding negative transcriptional regulator [Thraustotheca clavata]|uniref:FMN-binding negative transcriptional regulator n=1 Tax=Thraustotheca clavata TaxID=74557 RepID=A0A1W0AA18_9STRA|nr:FMN-binding negative transcriptional regulator [Thraustotheca clavata]
MEPTAVTYIPSAYREVDEARLHDIIKTHSFATLIVTHNNVPHISHVPLLFDKDSNTLRGHLARVNPIAKLDRNQVHNAVAIFHGPNAYITPSWYESKKTTTKVVPTWNYIVVHVQGKLRIETNPEWIYSNVSSLSDTHEEAIGGHWKLTDAPESYVKLMTKAIVGIELNIESILGNFKLSQEKKSDDFAGVLSGLKDAVKSDSTPNPSGSQGIAEWMERTQA